jgi:CHASE3 domain sensor protein
MIKWSNIKDFNNSRNTDLVNSINEQKLEQKKIVVLFEEKMKIFATERSIESSLDVLNISIQLTNIRGYLIRSFEKYVRNLEEEIVKLNRIIEKNQTSSDL